jgi:GR25 family glycosyltransferase involved in LPS biosynthesis
MKAYAIVIKDNDVSELGYENLVKSSYAVGNTFKIERYDAVTPDEAISRLKYMGLAWNYPWDKPVRDIASGLLKNPYPTKNRNARIACSLSHFNLWLDCYATDETVLIMEHDAIWKEQLASWVEVDPLYDIIGINDPRGATRRSGQFHTLLQAREALINRPPAIDEDHVPQGIAGNSAYIMRKSGAIKMLDLVREYGLWPNDALMCRQLVKTLGTSKIYYTGVQGLPSTTTL